MNQRSPSNFNPPRPEQLRAHLERHSPRGPSRLLAWLPIIALAGVVLLTTVTNDGWTRMLPWVILAALITTMAFRVRWVRHLEAQVAKVQELTMMRRFPTAMRLAWRLLPKVNTMPVLQGRIVAFMAHVLDQVRAYDAAIIAYDAAIRHLPALHPGAIQLQINRAITQLINDQLADADDALRRLRSQGEVLRHPTSAAAFGLANLTQQVRTNHFVEAVQSAPGLIELLRPLGIEAGYGHALMALACHQLADHRGASGDSEARPWWSRATLLLPAKTLVDRFPELSSVAGRYPASSSVPLSTWPSPRESFDHGPSQRELTDLRRNLNHLDHS